MKENAYSLRNTIYIPNSGILLPMIDYSQETDGSLASQSIENHDAFGELIGRYEKKLYRYIRRITNASHEECEDILQEVFLKAYRYLNNFDPTLSFSSWVYRIAHNETISHFRKRKVRPQTIKEEDGELYLKNLEADMDIEVEIDRATLAESVRKILAKLGAKYEDVLILKYLEEKSYEEISDILKIPVKTVGTRLNRAKKKMKEVMS
jgi:RNA polymerase sigma-70 factor, ECF subfamily